MSYHQPRVDRSDSQQRRNARPGGGSAHQRAITVKGSGAGGQGPSASAAPLLSPTNQSAPVPSSKRSTGANGQPGGHAPASFETSDNHPAPQSSQQVGNTQSGISVSMLPSNGNVSRSARSGTSSSTSTAVAPIIPKSESAWNSAHPPLSFQFGTLGPAYVQIPARTSSAPPNLDEQKQDLLRFEAVNAPAPKVPVSSGVQQHGPRPQTQQTGGQQQQGHRPQPHPSAVGIPQPQHLQNQAQQHALPTQVKQHNAHIQVAPVVTSQGHLQVQAHLVRPQSQQQGLVQLSYSQHTLQPPQSLMQHNGGHILKYPQPMAGSSMMGPPLASLPGPLSAPQLAQIPHQLSGGLGSTIASGMPGGPYGAVPVTSAFIPPRTSSAVKIVHPETHEELKFDYKSSKTDSFPDTGVPVTAAISQGRMIGNGPSLPRSSLGYASGVHHPINQNTYCTQQNGPYTPTQHFYQPPPTSGIPTSVTSGSKHNFSETSQGLEGSVKVVPVPTASTVSSSDETSGMRSVPVQSLPGTVSRVPQAAAEEKNAAVEKKEFDDNSSLGAVGQVKESKADVDGKAIEVQILEGSTAHIKDAQHTQEPVKHVQAESSDLVSTKDSHSSIITVLEMKQNSKKKKKKDGASKAHSGDPLKVSKSSENKKQVEGKVPDSQRTKALTANPAEQMELNAASNSIAMERVMSETEDVKSLVVEAGSFNIEPVPHVPSPATDELITSMISTNDIDETKPSGTVSLDAAVSGAGLEPAVNNVHNTTMATEQVLIVENQGDNFTVQVECFEMKESFELFANCAIPELSESQGTIIGESLKSTVEAVAEVNQGICEVLDIEPSKEAVSDAVTPDANARSAVSMLASGAFKVEDGSVSQNESLECQTSATVDLSVSSSSKDGSLEDGLVMPTADVRHGSKKKKMKDILAKADAAGTTADLYNAYKAPEEKRTDELMPSRAGNTKAPSVDTVKQVDTPEEIVSSRELDDWEDAVELPSPAVGTEGGDNHKTGERRASEVKEGETYTRDFLLTFKEQNLELPLDFEVRPDIAELLNPQAAFAHLTDHVSSGRMLDRQLSNGARRSTTANNTDDDRWARPPPGPYSPLWLDNYVDMGPGGGFRPGNAPGLIPRMPPNIRPGLTVPPLVSGLIPGKPMTPAASPLYRTNTIDSDRWQCMPSGQKGLIPSPQTPLPPVHKAEKRYEVGKMSDEEEQKQRQIKGILNKLTPQNFQKLFEQVKDVNIQSAITLTRVISQIFDKALTEPTFCEMYAMFCKQLAADMPEFVEDGDKVTFKRVLLNKCQEEFHRGEREQAEAATEEEDGQEKMSPEEREERRVTAKRRMLGNIRFIGELYKKHMLTERIMHECIRKLLGEYENPEEEVEALCKLMSTIGHMIDHPKMKEHIDAYFERMTRLSNNPKLSARLKFMLKDVIDLRKNGWQERRKVEGPKKIEEVHRDAVQERQATVAQAGRLSRGPSIGASSGRRIIAPPDLSTRGLPSPMFSPSTPMGSVPSMRGVQPQVGIRGSFVQDVRMEGLLLERSMPMPLSQRPVDEGPITLGPQGGLGRGMSMRGQSIRTDAGSGVVSSETRRFGPVSLPAYSTGGPLSVERPLTPPERPLLDKPSSAAFSNRGVRHLERTLSDKAVSSSASTPHQQQQGLSSRPSTAPAFVPLSEDQLKKKSEAAVIEYFSARDLKEAAQCVEDLRSPKFYPTMVCTWIALSFEKGNVERDLLAKLLIYLHKEEPFLLKQEQISEGFAMVMGSLEDLVLDAPKAPEHLAEILAALTSAETLSLNQVGGLLKRNDVLQTGFGLDMVGILISGLRQDKGERSLLQMFRSSGIRFEDFILSGNPGSKSLIDFLQKYNLQSFSTDSDVGASTDIQEVGMQLLDHFNSNEPIPETLRWLESSVTSPMQSDSRFLQMLMTQVLKHSIPVSHERDQSELVKERVPRYKMLLRRFATDKDKQRQYIVAMQLFVHDVGHPVGLMRTLFSTLYQEEVISEAAYYMWQDNVDGPITGRDKALRDVYKWLQWLKTAPEQSQDDEF